MLITAARSSIALAICSVEREHVISAGSGTLSARAPGQTPTMPRPLAGAAATEAVAVPCELATGNWTRASVLPPSNSGCVLSSWASTSAMSGLAGVTAGGASAGSTTQSRQSSGGTDRGSWAKARWCGTASVSGWAYTSRSRRSSALAKARARGRASA